MLAVQCSTPVGVKGMLIDGHRASWIHTPKCSTPVGVKGMLMFDGARLQHEWTVLNACRRQRNAHKAQYNSGSLNHQCSTPVGVKGMLMLDRLASPLTTSRAQRLSASKECSCAMSCWRGCSTPVGVKGMFMAPSVSHEVALLYVGTFQVPLERIPFQSPS